MNDFIKICAINLERDREGRIANESPIPKDPKEKPNPEDSVPYCKFRVSNTVLGCGVFLIKVDGKVKYVGSTVNFNRYFYGGCVLEVHHIVRDGLVNVDLKKDFTMK